MKVLDLFSGIGHDEIPDRVARLKALGNTIIPQIAQHIGEAIMEYENEQNEVC